MEAIVKHLKKGDTALQTLCANALFKVCQISIFLDKSSVLETDKDTKVSQLMTNQPRQTIMN